MMQMHQVALGPGVPPLSCAEQRQLQLLQIEMEQRREEQEALGITEEQCQILLHTFKSVKIEFSNLDGLNKLSSGKKRRTAHSGFVGLSYSTVGNSTGTPYPHGSRVWVLVGTGTGMVLVMMHVQVSVYESLLDTPMPLLRASPAPLSSPLPLPILTPTIMPTRGSHLKETW
ncbi:hypothetical protein BDQ17DRAFT_1376908 [Cyathus striatus]|nr:hypothetical protein BDQ17DRAFT_1376908 [Cyathus striatus]